MSCACKELRMADATYWHIFFVFFLPLLTFSIGISEYFLFFTPHVGINMHHTLTEKKQQQEEEDLKFHFPSINTFILTEHLA